MPHDQPGIPVIDLRWEPREVIGPNWVGHGQSDKFRGTGCHILGDRMAIG